LQNVDEAVVDVERVGNLAELLLGDPERVLAEVRLARGRGHRPGPYSIRNFTCARVGFPGKVDQAASRSSYGPGESSRLDGSRPVRPNVYEPGSRLRRRASRPMNFPSPS